MANPKKVGLVIAALIGGWHVIWVALVAVGWAQPLINFVFWAHMIQPIYSIKPFNAEAAVTLLAVTSMSGYILGYAGAMLWNRLHR
jgi:hypothetical protein